VPPGGYRRLVFYERATPETLNALTADVEVGEGDTRLADTTISGAGFIPLTHLNKHGQAYPHNAGGTEYSIPQ